jgi:hypothetical protein|tara:strand:+ start:661 stop:1251 length:591 start_codon:yes stop_codon:yes gene_type:complete
LSERTQLINQKISASEFVGGKAALHTQSLDSAGDAVADTSMGTGVDDSGTQRMTLATNIALPAGTNAIGKLSANTGVDIGDVDVLSLPATPAGTNNIGDVDVLTQVGAANIAMGQVSVDATSTGIQIVAARATRRTVTIVNHGTTQVFLKGGSVATTTGVLLVGTVGASATFESVSLIKGVTASGSVTVSYVEEYD